MDNVLRKAIEAKLASAGIDWAKLSAFHLDSNEKKLDAEVELEGEPEPVKVGVRYALDGKDVLVESVEASKPWMTKLAATALARHGGRFALPSGMQGSMIRMLL